MGITWTTRPQIDSARLGRVNEPTWSISKMDRLAVHAVRRRHHLPLAISIAGISDAGNPMRHANKHRITGECPIMIRSSFSQLDEHGFQTHWDTIPRVTTRRGDGKPTRRGINSLPEFEDIKRVPTNSTTAFPSFTTHLLPLYSFTTLTHIYDVFNGKSEESLASHSGARIASSTMFDGNPNIIKECLFRHAKYLARGSLNYHRCHNSVARGMVSELAVLVRPNYAVLLGADAAAVRPTGVSNLTALGTQLAW
ncbi:hypothetical protein OG21DRAFT_1602495 [Imleria badia]|nr:hypothetical protein OG21DRAFT_1602495 [Imleria badia]